MNNFKRENGKYYIDNKEVDEKVYISMLEEKTSKNSDNITIPKINMLEMEQASDCGEDGEEFCPECQEILDLIFSLGEMDERESIDTFKHIIFMNRREGFLEGLISAYDNIGSMAHKISCRYENQLDDIKDSQFDE
jgi:hypothetical protein